MVWGLRLRDSGFIVQGLFQGLWFRDSGFILGLKRFILGFVVLVVVEVDAAFCPLGPRQALRTLNKSQFLKILITFGDKCLRNGSKNDPMAPRTTMG